MYTCVIIDDEKKSVETLQAIIENFLDNSIRIVGTANNAIDGYKLILQTNPKIIFLDIEMPHNSGFDMLEMFEKINFEVIFTTGFDKYGIAAIKFSALDYLLKPINISELRVAVKKAIERIKTSSSTEQIQNLLGTIKSPLDINNKIPLPVEFGLEMVRVGDIVYCKAEQDYTNVYFKNQKTLLVSKSIKYFEELLEGYNFFRTHHSFLINKTYIKKYIKGEGGSIITDSDIEIPVSRRKKSEFLEWIKE